MIMTHAETAVQRAKEQRENYTFRSSRILGHLAVFVTNQASGTIYTVTFNGHHPRCNCNHYQHRLKGTSAPCKHIALVADWLGEAERFFQEQATPAMSAERLAVAGGGYLSNASKTRCQPTAAA